MPPSYAGHTHTTTLYPLSISSESRTHGGDVLWAALLATELIGEEHIIETLAQKVNEVLADATEVVWWQETPEVGQLGEPSQSLELGAHQPSQQR